MSINDFLTKQNVSMIWDVLIENDILKGKSSDIIKEVGNIVNQNIKGFFENERKVVNNLVELNKKFITLIIQYINKTYPLHTQQPQQQQNFKQISQVKKQPELITHNDLQSERISQFEKDLNQRQSEFTNAMTASVPQAPNFSDKLDEPLTEMELALKNAISQRNYDIEQVNKNFNTSQTNDSWLKGTETSIKNEKLSVPPSVNNKITPSNSFNQTNQTNNLKYIKIDTNPIENSILKKDIIDLPQKDSNQQKHISWEDENVKLNLDEMDNEMDNIFKKLKIIPQQHDTAENNSLDYDRINNLEIKVDNLTDKIDKILQYLQKG